MSQYNRQPVAPVIMVAAGVVLILGAVFWSMSMGSSFQGSQADVPGTSIQSPAGAGITTPSQPTQGGIRIPFPNIPRASLAEAKAAHDTGQAVFLDVRGDPFYSEQHIAGAISMTGDEIAARLGELDPNAWIIPYCT